MPPLAPPPDTERLTFRAWAADDLALAEGLWGDPQVTALLGGPLDAAQVAERLSREREHLTRHGVQYWPVFSRAGGEHVGCCGLTPYRLADDLFELGFHLRPAFWGQGLAREAARAVIDHAFTARGLSALYAGHHPDNAASRRLLEGLGFRYTHHERYPATGLDHPAYLLQRQP
jgi:RimJ/RimL family protein N-acetyltransferase